MLNCIPRLRLSKIELVVRPDLLWRIVARQQLLLLFTLFPQLVASLLVRVARIVAREAVEPPCVLSSHFALFRWRTDGPTNWSCHDSFFACSISTEQMHRVSPCQWAKRVVCLLFQSDRHSRELRLLHVAAAADVKPDIRGSRL